MADDHESPANRYSTALQLRAKLLARAGLNKLSRGLSQWTEGHPTKIEGMSLADITSLPSIEGKDIETDLELLGECLESCVKLCAEAYVQYSETYGQTPPQSGEIVGEDSAEIGANHQSEKAKGKRPAMS